MDYDVVVIGGGPAGEKGAAQAAYFGKRVAIVEREPEPGGACCHTGTLPSKSLRESALYLAGLAQMAVPGLQRTQAQGFSVREFMVRKDEVVQVELERIHENLRRHGIDLVLGAAAFEDPHTLRVGADRVRAESILIAVGSQPYHPPGLPFDDPLVDDSDSILAIDRIPETLVVLGAGVIGCEYACMFAALGVKVTMIEPGPRLLPFLDSEMGHLLEGAMLRRLGIDVRCNEAALRIEPGPARALVKLRSGAEVSCDRVLASVGRAGATFGLALERAGLHADPRGYLKVNEHFQTEVPHIYAAGDVIGFPSLAATGMEQARVAMTHACGQTYKTRLSPVIPYGIYTIPELSMVGETEESAQKKGIEYEVGRALYRRNARGQMIGDLEGVLKLVFRAQDKRILGVHAIGERATELVHIGQAVLALGGTIDYFIDAIFNYPTLSELYKYAAYDGLARLAARA
ncbi:MAG TPA: Si-specific NAD(P)(+) transhydrogenase [Polyangia bacterium]|nr:Si-specific NAD(P)(+) transhydrogenase [Polyangia bacterium]